MLGNYDFVFPGAHILLVLKILYNLHDNPYNVILAEDNDLWRLGEKRLFRSPFLNSTW